MPEVVDEGVALRVGLEHQEGVDFRAEDDRLDVAQKILEADVERGDLFLPLALAELADALAGRRLFLRGFIFRWRRGSAGLRENGCSKRKRQCDCDRSFHDFPD